MAITLITKNSTVASKRPTATQLVAGELGLNLESTDPGLYFEDSAGNIRKIGGAHYGATAPNVAPAGQTGNSVGELWYNTVDAKLYIWDGATWTVAGGSDTQSFYEVGPWAYGTNRPDGQPLLPGDEWYDTSTAPATTYVWDGATWVLGSNDTHAFTGAGDPITLAVTLRPDGGALQNGDIYIDTTSQVGYYYNLALTTWTMFGSDTHAFYLAGPAWPYGTNRPNGAALVEGDRWYDTSSTPTLPYVWTGLAWVDDPLSVLAMPVGPVKADKTTQELFYYNEQNVSLDYTLLTTSNAMSAGPITIDPGVTVTIPVGGSWSIL